MVSLLNKENKSCFGINKLEQKQNKTTKYYVSQPRFISNHRERITSLSSS